MQCTYDPTLQQSTDKRVLSEATIPKFLFNTRTPHDSVDWFEVGLAGVSTDMFILTERSCFKRSSRLLAGIALMEYNSISPNLDMFIVLIESELTLKVTSSSECLPQCVCVCVCVRACVHACVNVQICMYFHVHKRRNEKKQLN